MERVDYESLIIQDLLNFYETRTLDISPWYQRRSVWSTPQKAYLINTIFERKPVPSLYVRHHIDLENERSVKEVVDGQQRIRAIISYRDGDFSARHPEHGRRVKYSELTRTDRAHFLSTALSVGYLIGADDRDVVEIFGRINSVLKSLNPQEKRNAVYSGEFKQFCLREAACRLPFWRATNLFSATDISRMQEVQFVSDVVVNMIDGLSDFSPGLINGAYKKYDAEFPHEHDISQRLERVFDKLVSISPEYFYDTIFKSVEVALSLILVIDELGPERVREDRLRTVIRDIDAQLIAFSEVEELTEEQTRIVSAFTGGNLHRIRKRAPRREVLLERLG